MDANSATERQVKLIESLYSHLRIRNTSLYGGAQPAQLSKQRASEVIEVLRLRKLSGQIGRPVTADLTDPMAVRKELARVEQLTDGRHSRHAATAAMRAAHMRDASEVAEPAEPQNLQPTAPRVRLLPHVRRRVDPQPRITLAPEQLAARAADLDHVKEPRLDAAGRYSDVTGYGSAASYAGNGGRLPSDAPQLTDEQEHRIIDLQNSRDDTTVSNTVIEASEYLDQALAPPEPLPPTERQLSYLHKLEREAGKTDQQLSHPSTRQGASRRIQRYVHAADRTGTTSADQDLVAAMALTDLASPRLAVESTPVLGTQHDDRRYDSNRSDSDNQPRTDLRR